MKATRAALWHRRQGVPQTAPVDDPNNEAGPLLDDEVVRQCETLGLYRGSALTDGLPGEQGGGRRSFDIEFADYRGYTPGDDFRHVDWNAYARLGQLFVKTGVMQEALSLSLLIDTSRSMDWGRPNKLHYAKRLAAILGAIAILHYDAVYLAPFAGDTIPTTGPLRGREALETLQRTLEELPVYPTTTLRSSLEAYRYRERPRGITVVISDMLVPPDQLEALSYLSDDGQQVILLHLVSPDEANPPLWGRVELRDRETAAPLTVTVTPGLRRRYQARLEGHARSVATACARYGLRYLHLPLTASPLEAVLTTLRDHEIVR